LEKNVQKFSVIVEREDGWYIAECPALPGCVSQGRTLDEALKNIREAIELSLETRAAHKIGSRRKTFEIEVQQAAE
jgi:predicted RNase H-like HicB family nuclease